jgi:hypothetical protein
MSPLSGDRDHSSARKGVRRPTDGAERMTASPPKPTSAADTKRQMLTTIRTAAAQEFADRLDHPGEPATAACPPPVSVVRAAGGEEEPDRYARCGQRSR